MSARVPALLVTHADLSSSLLRAAAQIVGPVEGVEAVSNTGLSKAELEAEIARRVERWEGGGLVLTDFWGGSCTICGLSATRGRGEIVVVTGINLPTLLDYLHNRDRLATLELAERLQKKGQESIRLQRASPA
jgi:mannose/fructose-specific phosphotransferase system component IIA